MVERTLAAIAVVLVAWGFFHVLVQPSLGGKAEVADITLVIVGRCVASIVVLIQRALTGKAIITDVALIIVVGRCMGGAVVQVLLVSVVTERAATAVRHRC